MECQLQRLPEAGRELRPMERTWAAMRRLAAILIGGAGKAVRNPRLATYWKDRPITFLFSGTVATSSV
jgi:hypothetical protein